MDRLRGWKRRGRVYWLNLPVLAGLYFVTARFGLSLAHATRQITAVWPASGLALVALLLLGYSYWPAIVVGALIANWSDKEPLLVALAIAAGNTLEAVVGVWVVRRLSHGNSRVNTPQAAGAIGLGAILGSIVAATAGATSLTLGGVIAPDEWLSSWLMWWGADTLGTLLFGSTLLVLFDPTAYAMVRQRLLEAGLLLALVFAASTILFTVHPAMYSRLHFYLLFPFMVWAALRFTRLGVVAVTMVLTAVGVWANVNGLGPLGMAQIDATLVQFLLFVLVTAGTSLMLGMAIDARQAAVAALQAQKHQLETLEAELKDANRRVTDILAGVLRTGEADEDQPGSSPRWSG
jgi:integral membrane sensor domain MASE1